MTEYDGDIPTQEQVGRTEINTLTSTGREQPEQVVNTSHFDTLNTSPDENRLTMYPIAGFWVRLLAFIIDLLIITGLNSIIWDSLLPAAASRSFIYTILHVNSLFLGITGAVYFILMTRFFQQTLGKMIVGIKVIQRNGEPLSWVTVIFRELVARSLSQLMGLNLGYIVCWFNPEKRCVHDYLSDTWVVYENPESHRRCVSIN